MHFKILFVKWCPFSLILSVLNVLSIIVVFWRYAQICIEIYSELNTFYVILTILFCLIQRVS